MAERKSQLQIYVRFMMDTKAAKSADHALKMLSDAGMEYNKRLNKFYEVSGQRRIRSLEATVGAVGKHQKAQEDAIKKQIDYEVQLENQRRRVLEERQREQALRAQWAENEKRWAENELKYGAQLEEQARVRAAEEEARRIAKPERELSAAGSLLAYTKDWGKSVHEVAVEFANVDRYESQSVDKLEQNLNLAKKINESTLQQLAQKLKIKTVGELDLQLAKDLLKQSQLTRIPVELLAAEYSKVSDKQKETYEYVMASVKAVQAFGANIKNADQNLGLTVKKLSTMQQQVRGFMGGFVGFQLMMTGMQMQRVAKQMLSPIEKFTAAQGETDAVAKQWLKTQKDIEKSFIRVGKIMAQELLPTMLKIAKLADRLADFVEANPSIAKAVGWGAIGSMAVGSILMLVGQIWTGLFAFKNALTFFKGLNLAGMAGNIGGGIAAAGGARALARAGVTNVLVKLSPGIESALRTLAAGMTGTQLVKALGLGLKTGFEKILLALAGGTPVTALAPGIGTGLAIASLFPEKGEILGQPYQKVDFGELASIIAYSVGSAMDKLLKDTDRAERWFLKVARATGDWTDAVEEATEELEVSEDALKAYEDWAREEAEAHAEYLEKVAEEETDFQESSKELQSDYHADLLDMQQDYEADRAKIIEDYLKDTKEATEDFARASAALLGSFQRASAEAAAEYQRNRAEIISDYQREEQEAAAQHQRDLIEAYQDYLQTLRDLERDHQRNMADAIAENDALALVREERRYADELQAAQENYRNRVNEINQEYELERQARAEQFQRTLQELDQEYLIEEAKRKEEFLREQAEAQAEFELERQRAAEEYQAQLADLEAAYGEQKQARAQQYKDEILELRKAHRNKLIELQNEYNQERTQRAQNLRVTMQTLLGIEQQGHNAMLAAARAYIAQLLAAAKSLQTQAPGNQIGGYVRKRGIYTLAEAGKEFVLDNTTTNILENTIGYLTQEKVSKLAPEKEETVLTVSFDEEKKPKKGFKFGGYVDRPGTYQLAEAGREFVINNETTKILEREFGPLTQETLTSLILSSKESDSVSTTKIARTDQDRSVKSDHTSDSTTLSYESLSKFLETRASEVFEAHRDLISTGSSVSNSLILISSDSQRDRSDHSEKLSLVSSEKEALDRASTTLQKESADTSRVVKETVFDKIMRLEEVSELLDRSSSILSSERVLVKGRNQDRVSTTHLETSMDRSVTDTKSIQQYKAGGYVFHDGIYRIAERDEREFILSHETTSALERDFGTLTQEKLQQAFTTEKMVEHLSRAQAKSTTPQLFGVKTQAAQLSMNRSVQQELHFHQGISASDRSWIRQMIANEAQEVLYEIVRG